MINSRVELLFKNLPDRYPHHLERDYIRILNRLMQLWDTPEFDSLMHELMLEDRSDRKGFPVEVINELMFLGELHDIFFRSNEYRLPQITDSWKDIPVPNPTPQGFYQAIERGQLEVIENFLRAGVKADYRFEGELTPLMVAVISGQLGAVRCLIENGAGVNLRDGGDYTALHWAAFYGHSPIIEALIDADAEINAKQNRVVTPFGLALARNRMDVAKQLLEHQTDPKIAVEQGLLLTNASDRKNKEIESGQSKNKDAGPNKSAGEKAQPGIDNKSPLFLYIPPARLVLMSVASFGLYQPYWFYKNWQHIKERNGLDISPFWRACFGIFFCHSLLRRIYQDKKAHAFLLPPPFSSNWLASGWVILLLVLTPVGLRQINESGILVILGCFLFPPLCLVPAQIYINAVTKKMNSRQQFHGWPWGYIDALIFSVFFVLAAFGLDAYQSYHKRTLIVPIQDQAIVVPTPVEPDLPAAGPPTASAQPKKHASRTKAKQTQTAANPVAAYTFDDLINAVWHSDTNGVDHLLGQGMDINRRDGSGSTLLIVAIENNDVKMVKHLIDKGADPNMPRQRDGYVPIVVAKTAPKPNAELIELLKASGAKNPFDQSVNPLRH